MKIILIGYRGTGKTLVGHAVARRLDMTCISMDEVIVASAEMSIPELVAEYGWSKFRDMESVLAKELASQDNIIIDTGGGIIERPENMQTLGKDACVVWLKASVEVIVARIEKDSQRPPLVEGKTFTEEVSEVLTRRYDKYQAAAHYEIDTDDLTIDDISDRIVAYYKKHGQRDER
jgi:shikimate kinase